MPEYRKKKGSDVWHWCKNCSKWPTSDYDAAWPPLRCGHNTQTQSAPPRAEGYQGFGEKGSYMKKKSFLCAMVFLPILLAVTSPMPSHAAADCSSSACTDRIGRIYVTRNGNLPWVYVSIEDRATAVKKLSCTTVSGWYFTLRGDHPAFDEMFRVLMDAKNRKGTPTEDGRNKVTFRLVDGSPTCEIQYIYIEWSN
jgi:hypothetical protein